MTHTTTQAISTKFDLALSSSKPIRVKHYGLWVATAFVLVFGAWILYSVATNDNLDYQVFAKYLTAKSIMGGLLVTIELSLIGMAIGIVFGVVIALFKLSASPILRSFANGYIWFFRGVPLLVQLLVWGNFALLFPKLGIGIPFTDVMFFGIETNSVITVFVATCLGLGFHEAAYMSEVIRAGIQSVDTGQKEAAVALGMTSGLAMRRIILPQAFRTIIPPTGNQFISLIKASSLVAVISGGDLLHEVQSISAINFRVMELLFVASFWYLAIVSVLTVGQHFIEKYASRGFTR